MRKNKKVISLKQRKKHSEIMKKKWADKNSVFRSSETIKKKSQKMKNHWKDKNSKLNSSERSEKISKKTKKTWANSNYRDMMSNNMINLRNNKDSIYNTEEYIQKHKKSYTKKVRNQMSKKVKKAWGEGRLGDDNWKRKRKEFMKNGGSEYASSFIDKENQKEILRIKMKNGGSAHANKFIKNPSKPQVELFKLCQSILPYPIMNYPCLNYSIDIAIPILNLAVEYDSSYWHKDREEQDKIRQTTLEREGWKFLRYLDYVPSKKELIKSIKAKALEDFKNEQSK